MITNFNSKSYQKYIVKFFEWGGDAGEVFFHFFKSTEKYEEIEEIKYALFFIPCKNKCYLNILCIKLKK